jgi:tRNA modification GTPase
MGETIFAMATGAGGALQVLRLSGPATGPVLAALAGPLPVPRRASLRTLRDAGGAVLDVGMVLWLPGPATFSGEDSAELSLHGGPAVRDAVCDALTSAGARPAERGEFTRRAFLNGRIGLTEAEAVADLIAAETEAQRRQAVGQMQGALAGLLNAWAARLRHLLATAEALIDFPEETLSTPMPVAAMRALAAEMTAAMGRGTAGERLREGLCFTVLGPVNAGKSSLVNALTHQDAAIVSDLPGTTRDAIEVRTVFGGVPVTLVDTAGLRPSADKVEQEGVRRARARATAADLVVLVTPADRDADSGGEAAPEGVTVLRVTSKCDLGPQRDGSVGVSLVGMPGLGALRDRLDAEARRLTETGGAAPLTRARHRASVAEAAWHLGLAAIAAAPDLAADAAAPELAAEELRLAVRALGRATGTVDVDRVLDDIFLGFCIGK